MIWVSIAWGYGLSPVRRQAITWPKSIILSRSCWVHTPKIAFNESHYQHLFNNSLYIFHRSINIIWTPSHGSYQVILWHLMRETEGWGITVCQSRWDWRVLIQSEEMIPLVSIIASCCDIHNLSSDPGLKLMHINDLTTGVSRLSCDSIVRYVAVYRPFSDTL